MGLDSVELILGFEDEFGMEIPQEVAEKMLTPGDVYNYFRAKLADKSGAECLSQEIFYKLRRALVANYGIQRHLLSPDTNLLDHLSYDEIEDGWPFLQMFIDLETPDFRSAQRGWFGYKPRKVLTLRAIVDRLIGLNANLLSIDLNSNEKIWERVVDVTISQLNVSRSEVHKDSSFTKDLGMD